MAERWQLGAGFRVALHDPEDEVAADAVLAFWELEDVLAPAERHRRVAEVLVVATDAAGEVAGVGTTYLDDATALGSPLWFYRTYVGRGQRRSAVGVELALAAREHLAARFAGGDQRGIGMAWEVQNAALRAAWPDAVWPLVDMALVGRTLDGDDLRVWFFPGAQAPAPPPPPTAPVELADGHRVALLAGHPDLRHADVVRLWVDHDVLPEAIARRRAAQALLVATDAAGALVGVGTTYLALQPQLGLPMWHYRTFVLPEHRGAELAREMAATAHAHLAARWRAGVDRRGRGLVFEVENAGLRDHLRQAIWPRTRVEFMARLPSADVRVRYFPGALAPPPPG